MSYMTQVDSQPSQISKMERFAKIGHVWQGSEWHMETWQIEQMCIIVKTKYFYISTTNSRSEEN